ncbi:MAG: hypothetical protein JNL81_05625 [Hyphomonadaceae bacterium]|nr:hypothetical protein [Hyphomonadaceae bacterium]
MSTLSFAAGVAGDLSIMEQPRSGQRVVLRIPPEIPADAPRAAPLLSTASAAARPVRRARQTGAGAPVEVRFLVESVQAAHEDGFQWTPVLLEASALQQLKPQTEGPVKPAPFAAAQANETKVA